MEQAVDKAGVEFWNDRWKNVQLPEPVNPADTRLRRTINGGFHRYFQQALSGMAGKTLLEIGAGRSRWLPYFYRTHGLQADGLDYSAAGCEQAREILSRANVPGTIYQADLFEPSDELLGKYDVVVSLGVVEHFSNQAATLRAMARYLRPGGMIITEIPNMVGMIGAIHKRISRSIYDKHVIMDKRDLASAHQDAGLVVADVRYLLTYNWAVISFPGDGDARNRFYTVRPRILTAISMLFWALQRARILRTKPNRRTSPYIICLARKPL